MPLQMSQQKAELFCIPDWLGNACVAEDDSDLGGQVFVTVPGLY